MIGSILKGVVVLDQMIECNDEWQSTKYLLNKLTSSFDTANRAALEAVM